MFIYKEIGDMFLNIDVCVRGEVDELLNCMEHIGPNECVKTLYINTYSTVVFLV